MSYHTWHDYGYGVNLYGMEFNSAERVVAVLTLAPNVLEQIKREFAENEITEPTVADYLEYGDFMYGMAGLLREVIEEAEGISFYASEDFDGCEYIMYPPIYPWEMQAVDQTMSKEKVEEILNKYLKILTDSHYDIEMVECANGG